MVGEPRHDLAGVLRPSKGPRAGRGAVLVLAVLLAVGSRSASARSTTPARTADLLIDQWTVDDGLPLNHLTDLALAPDGSLWLSTYDGLVNFDGDHFEVLRRSNNPRLPSNRFTQVATTAAGQVWAASEGGDLVRLDDGVATYSPGAGLAAPVLGLVVTPGAVWARSGVGWIGLDDAPHPPVGPAGVPLTNLGLVADGSRWSGSVGAGLFLSRPSGEVTRVIPPTREPQTTRVLGVVGDAVWVGDTGVHVYRSDTVRTIRPDGDRSFGDVCALIERPDGVVEVRDRSGWWRVEGGTAKRVIPAENLRCFLTAHMGTVWPWRAAGAQVIRGYDAVWEGKHEVLSVLPAGDGAVWVATAGDGLLRVSPRTFATIPPPGSWQRPSVEAVMVDEHGHLWMGSMLEGLWRTDPPTEVMFSMTPAGGTVPGVLGMVEHGDAGQGIGGDGSIEVGTNVSLCSVRGARCDGFREPFRGDESAVLVPLLVDRHDRTWFGGLDSWVDGRDGVWVRSQIAGTDVWTEVRDDAREAIPDARVAAEGSDGAIYLGTAQHGLVRVRMAGNHVDGVRHLRLADGLSSDRIRSVYPEPGGAVWIGTEDAGLCRWRESDDRVGCLGLEQGLADDVIHAILPDDMGRLWLSGNRGVSWIRRDMAESVLAGDERSVLAVAYDERHGMMNRECNGGLPQSAVRDSRGRLWFATQSGVVRVDPRDVPMPTAPRVRLTSVLIDDRDRRGAIGDDGVLRLGATDRELAISWTAPDLQHEGDVRFRYRFDGASWSQPTHEHHSRWLGLPAGPRLLEIQAGLGGRWGTTPMRITIDRAPTFVETAWFPFSIALGTASIGLLGTVAWFRRQRRTRVALEAEVAGRTAELVTANADLARQGAAVLAQSERLAELDRLRTRFIADLSHEFRTPLALVTGPLEDLARTLGASLDVHAQKRLAMIQANMTRLDALSEQLLDVARLDADTIRIRVRRRDLAVFIDEIAARFVPAAELRGIALTTVRNGGQCRLYFDRDLLDKVLTNLLGNALKFTERGAITVTLTAPPDPEVESGGRVDADDGVVRVEVEDTGIGIPTSALTQLWGRFYQVDRGDSRRYNGVGIGLALVRDLVQLHGGDVGVTSVVGRGSTFWFTLPLGAAHLTLSDVDTSPALGQEPISPPPASLPPLDDLASSRPTVLVVEDHPDMRAFLVMHLGERYAVREAVHGAAALASALAEPPDIIVSDVMMPGMTGLELCARLRAEPPLTAIPVILVSAKGADEDRVAGLEAADDYMTKPVRPRELLARVQRLLSSRRSRVGVDALPSAAASNDSPTAPSSPDSTTASSDGKGRSHDAAEDDLAEDDPAKDTAEDAADGEIVAPESLDPASLRNLTRIQRVVIEHLANPAFGVIELAAALASSRRQLQREVRRLTGRSPSEFLRAVKMAEARRLLQTGARDTVSEVAADVGLSPAYFSRLYSAWFGRAPSDELRPGPPAQHGPRQ